MSSSGALVSRGRLSNGNTLFNAGTGGLIREVTPGGDVAWEATWNPEGRFYKLTPVDDLYGAF